MKPKLKVKLKSKPIDPTNVIPSEHEEQVKVIAFCRQYPLLANVFAIPNGGKRSMVAAMNAKAEGLTPGVPDLFVPFPNGQYHGLFIEMKRLKGGVLSLEQKVMIARLNSAGYLAVVCKGHLEAIDVLCKYANMQNPYEVHE